MFSARKTALTTVLSVAIQPGMYIGRCYLTGKNVPAEAALDPMHVVLSVTEAERGQKAVLMKSVLGEISQKDLEDPGLMRAISRSLEDSTVLEKDPEAAAFRFVFSGIPHQIHEPAAGAIGVRTFDSKTGLENSSCLFDRKVR